MNSPGQKTAVTAPEPVAVTTWLWWATAVLLLAAALRLIALAGVPPGLAQDEVLNADIALFIRQGAHSLFFREGYGHEPLYHYWTVPFQVLLGDNVLAIRLPAVALGLFLVAATMRWARRAFDPAVAILAGAFLAISWWPIVFSRIGLRPIMEPLLLVIFAWFWPRRPWLAGLVLGLSLYTYTGARVVFLWPLLLALYWLLGRKRVAAPRAALWGRTIPRPLLAAIIVLMVSLAVALPLALTLRADPTLQQRVQQLEGPLAALQQGDPRPVLQTTLATLGFFSFTGDPRWTYMLPGRPLFDPLTAVAFYGGVFLALRRFRQPWYAFLLFWLLVGILPSAITPQAPSSVRLVGAMPAVYTLPALALGWLWQRRQEPGARAWLRAGVPLLLASLLALNLGFTLLNGFVRWPQALETRLKYQTVFLDIARYLREQPQEAPVFADSFYRPITADSLRRDLGAPVQGRWVQTGDEVAGALVLPAAGNGRLFVPEYAAPAAQLLAAAGVSTVPLYRSGGRPSFAVYELPAAARVPPLDGTQQFEDKLSLVGYEIVAPQSGQALQLVTAWRVLGELPPDLAIFVHWLDEEQQLLSQHDGLDVAPATLRPGDVILQRHLLPWKSPLPALTGSLRLGLYLRADGRRLQTTDRAGAPSDHVAIPLLPEGEEGAPGG